MPCTELTIQQIFPAAAKTAYSPCISSLKVRLTMEGSAVLRHLLTGFLMTATLALVGCDDAPEDVNADTTPDTGLFVINKEVDQSSLDKGMGVERVRLVELNTETFAALVGENGNKPSETKKNDALANLKKVRLNLFPDVVVTAEVELAPGIENGPVFYGGRIEGVETSLVTLMLQAGKITGNIRLNGQLYRVRPSDGKTYRIEKVKPLTIPDHTPEQTKRKPK
jgi:hypothetical protein